MGSSCSLLLPSQVRKVSPLLDFLPVDTLLGSGEGLQSMEQMQRPWDLSLEAGHTPVTLKVPTRQDILCCIYLFVTGDLWATPAGDPKWLKSVYLPRCPGLVPTHVCGFPPSFLFPGKCVRAGGPPCPPAGDLPSWLLETAGTGAGASPLGLCRRGDLHLSPTDPQRRRKEGGGRSPETVPCLAARVERNCPQGSIVGLGREALTSSLVSLRRFN